MGSVTFQGGTALPVVEVAYLTWPCPNVDGFSPVVAGFHCTALAG